MKKLKILLSFGISSTLLFGCSSPQELSFKNDKVEIELGDKIDKELISKLVSSPDLIPENLTIKVDGKKASEINIGEHTLTLSGDGILETKKKIYIKDTTPPKITQKNNTVEINSNVDLKTLFDVSDLSDCNFSVNSDGFDISKAGSYDVNVIASDKYDNQTSQKFTITVKDSKAEADKVANTLTEDEKVWAESYTKIYTKDYVLSPSSIEWASEIWDGENAWSIIKVNGIIQVFTTMECENAFGVVMSYDVYTQFQTNSDGKAENMTLISLQIDGEQYYGHEQ